MGVLLRILPPLLLLVVIPVAAQQETDLRPERAVELYDAGDYEAARGLLEELDAEGKADGPLLYRLSFCRRAAGDVAGEREARERAIGALEAENRSATDLLTPFYLANAYSNAGRKGDSRAVASGATKKFESGAIPRPEDPMDMFRLAKLYADQGAEDSAAEWYGRALEGFAASDRDYPGNEAWAHRYLAERAYARADYVTAAEQFAALAELPRVSTADLDRLAVARVRTGDFKAAEAAWRRAEQLDPANADRPRYCRNLARMAAAIGTLPEQPPEGSDWSRLPREELETLMSAQAAKASETIAAAEGADDEKREELRSTLAQAKATFVRAALEYAVRNYPIRETAFAGGYAPMIFHDNRWELPPADHGGKS